MSQHRVSQKARTWIFKAHAVARPASAFFKPAFFPQILDGCKPRHVHMISKADTICYLATETDPEHAEGFIHACILNQDLPHAVTDEPGGSHQRILTEQLKSIVAKIGCR